MAEDRNSPQPEANIKEQTHINFFALTPFEKVSFGSGYEMIGNKGEKVQVNAKNLLSMVRDGKIFINEDFFWPTGLNQNQLTPNEVVEQREKFPKLEGITVFSFFVDEAQDLFFDKGFVPVLELAKFDPEYGLTDRKLRIGLRHSDPQVTPTVQDFEAMKLREGYESVFTRNFDEEGLNLVIGITGRAQHGERALAA